MFIKLILFLVYIVILFLLTRILETLTWIEVGNLSRRLLDPMTMSVMKLKALLDQRGISYEGAIEKQELAELVESSGAIAEDTKTNKEEEISTVAVTNFTTGSLFDEHVEDAKDSIWLVYIIPDQSHVNYLADTSWNIIKQKMSAFGVNIGVFDCSLDPMYCARRDWYYTCLILGLPEEFQTKSKVTLFQYTGPFKVNNIHSWIKESISKKVHTVNSLNSYSNNWMQYITPKDPSEVRVVMFSKYPSIPLFYSSVSVKFPGRVKFGFVDSGSKSGKDILYNIQSIKPPTYLIITSEYILVYGQNFGEDLNFKSMETYLKTLYPCVNDIFILSLIICNCVTLLEISLAQGTFIKRLMKFIWCIVKINMCLLLIWIALLTLLQLPLMHNITVLCLKLLRLCRLSTFGTLFYKDYCFYSRHFVFTEIFFCLYLVTVGYIQYKRKGPLEEEEDVEVDEWNFSEFRTLEHLFSPTAGLFRSAGIPAIDPERVHMRDMPTLRQICSIPDDYITKLPKWQFIMDKTVENLGNIDIISQSEETCKCDCNSDPPGKTFSTQLCEKCRKIQNESNGPKSSPSVKKKHLHLDRLKNSDPTTTDQSDTDQEKDAMEDEHLHLENSQCVICLDDYTKGVWLCGLPCGHSFHQTCIHIWLTRDNHYCPVCRWTSYTPKPSYIHLHSE
ncbi:E3 ubiquitin-protein ligase RNF103-like [Mytilus galloprovincialis]|uniref:E3 ubiquitin-protein ligase RNF103-like n=1 Tax=Mytilus galloprovincialis TaxID=29158 RepID=UPI003F7C58AB